VTLRRYGRNEQHTLSVEAFEAALKKTIETRALSFEV